MEKTPSSVIIGSRRGEITWMPEKARASVCREGRTSSGFPVASGPPAAKLELLVEEQVSGGLPVLHRQRGESPLFSVKLHHAPKIDRADHIDIVQNEWLFRMSGILEKKPAGLFQAAAGVEQDVLARDLNSHAEVVRWFFR